MKGKGGGKGMRRDWKGKGRRSLHKGNVWGLGGGWGRGGRDMRVKGRRELGSGRWTEGRKHGGRRAEQKKRGQKHQNSLPRPQPKQIHFTQTRRINPTTHTIGSQSMDLSMSDDDDAGSWVGFLEGLCEVGEECLFTLFEL